jgi:hypothetical protein
MIKYIKSEYKPFPKINQDEFEGTMDKIKQASKQLNVKVKIKVIKSDNDNIKEVIYDNN